MPFPNPDTQFKPGQVANPGGRPKGRSLTARLRAIVEREAKDGKDYGDLVMEVLVKSAMRGDMKAVALLLDRVDGKVVQQIQVHDATKSYSVETSPDKL